MTVSPARVGPSRTPPRSQRTVAVTRAVAAVIWAAIFLAALHGQRVLTGDRIPVAIGLLLAAYPLIDAAAIVFEPRRRPDRTRPVADLVIDGVAVVGLLIAALAFHTGSVLVVFGTWALVSGLLQLGHAWRANAPRRVQTPLIISGAISVIAGISFAALATKHTAQLANLAGYAVLGAVFFVVWTYLNRTRSAQGST